MDGDVILSQEGTTQGDPLAMAMYGLATIPLIRRLDGLCKQVWYADDSMAAGKLAQLREWWDKLESEGPNFGNFANASITWLVTKNLERASDDTGVNITPDGRPYLGAPIGSQEFTREYVRSKIGEWSSNVTLLSEIAKSQPHAAFTALTHGLMSKWTYISRVTPNIGDELSLLDDVLRSELIPAFTGRPLALYALHTRLGGRSGDKNPLQSCSRRTKILPACHLLSQGAHPQGVWPRNHCQTTTKQDYHLQAKQREEHQRSLRPLQPVAGLSAEGCDPRQGKGCLHLAHCPSPHEPWLCPPQVCFP